MTSESLHILCDADHRKCLFQMLEIHDTVTEAATFVYHCANVQIAECHDLEIEITSGVKVAAKQALCMHDKCENDTIVKHKKLHTQKIHL